MENSYKDHNENFHSQNKFKIKYTTEDYSKKCAFTSVKITSSMPNSQKNVLQIVY